MESSDMGLGRQSKSAGGYDENALDDGEMAASNKLYSVASAMMPKPYISPYDEDMAPKD